MQRNSYRQPIDLLLGGIGFFFLVAGLLLLAGMCYDVYSSSQREAARQQEIQAGYLWSQHDYSDSEIESRWEELGY
jgi:hypothetical protein